MPLKHVVYAAIFKAAVFKNLFFFHEMSPLFTKVLTHAVEIQGGRQKRIGGDKFPHKPTTNRKCVNTWAQPFSSISVMLSS